MLRALCEYYDCLRSQPDSGFVKEGYGEAILQADCLGQIRMLEGEIGAIPIFKLH